MDCRTFRRHHLAFVDDTLPGVDVIQMERHRTECAACARLDADVRRSLLLIRNNLPTIQPSDDFSSRLARRLEDERLRSLTPPPLFRGPGLRGFVSMSMGVVALGVLSVALTRDPVGTGMARLPGVVIRPNGAPTGMNSAPPLAPPAFVASVSTGMAVWPALLMMEEVQMRYADERDGTDVQPVSYSGQLPH
jgi:hypothetical protein